MATRNANVAITSNKLGIPLPTELYAFWLRVMGLHKMKELLFTARPLSADDAYHAGLYNHVVEPDRLEDVTRDFARRIVECAPQGLANAKFQLNLIALQSAMNEADRAGIEERNLEILNSPATKERILELLAAVQKKF